jgi:hypothetical protein
VRANFFPGLLVGLIGYVSLVPFYYLRPLEFGPALPSVNLPKYAPILVVSIGLALHVLRRTRRLHPRTDLIDGLTIGVLAVGAASLINAEFPIIGFAKWAYFGATGVLLAHAVAGILTDPNVTIRFVHHLAQVFGVVILYTCFCHWLGYDPLWGEIHQSNNPYYLGTGRRASAAFGNPVSTGAYLLLALPILAWVAKHGVRAWHRGAAFICGILGIYCAVMTQSRGTWLALGILLLPTLYLAVVALWRLEARHRIALITLTIAGLCAILWLSAYLANRDSLWSKAEELHSRAMEISPSRIAETEPFRISQYRTVANVILMHPALGVGFGNFTRVYDIYRHHSSPSVERWPARTTENMYLMTVAETGLIGLAGFLALLAAVMKFAILLGRRLPLGPERALVFSILVAMAALLVNMTTWDALNEPTIRILFWTFAGVIMSFRATSPV